MASAEERPQDEPGGDDDETRDERDVECADSLLPERIESHSQMLGRGMRRTSAGLQ